MATFQAIGLNLAIGSGVFATSMVLFAVAVQFEFNDKIAPRTWARPKEVIKNVLGGHFYGTAWIPWTLSLSYKEMLEGVPGTGTRKKGWSGKLLTCNLDGIVIIKFHALCLKVAIFATVFCMCVILPINITATCDPDISGVAICNNITRLTNFEETTLAHVPPMDFVEQEDSAGDAEDLGRRFSSAYIVQSLERYFWTSPGTTWRLFLIVFVSWAICIYSCILLWNEWIDNLALRRVFYLEHDHYKERKDELKYLGSLTDPELDFQSKRPPFIPHPEVRDTVPNISLYSVLYKLPDYFYSTAALADSSMLDRQLASTVDFFDKCVPNQPGYSSSVAAVTIIPDTTQVAQAWRKWYRCASRLRRLRFIRRRIIELEERLPTNNVDGDESVIDFQESTSLFESLNGYKNADGEANINTEGVAQRGLVGNVAADPQSPHPSSPHAPSLTPSPRHRKDLSILSTVEEFDDILSDPSSTHLLRRDDIEQARIAEMDIEISARRDEVDTAGDQNGEADKVPSPQDIRIRRSASDELSPFSSRESEIEIKTPSDSLSKKENAEDRSKPVQPRVPPIETQSASNDHSDERRFACPSDSLRKSPDSVGLAEEAKLDAFISDEGMEQLSVYCREFSQSSAGCCIYGCDYHRLAWANLAELKDYEAAVEEMVEEANQELIEARASVNKNATDIESGASESSLIAFRRFKRRSISQECKNSLSELNINAGMKWTS